MARIRVAKGLGQEDENREVREDRQFFADALGREIIAKGHVLLGGCRTLLDAKVAAGAEVEALQRRRDPNKFPVLGHADDRTITFDWGDRSIADG